MRSETVVLPASMWAAIPMLRTLVRSRGISIPSTNTKPAEASPRQSSGSLATAGPNSKSGSAPAGQTVPQAGQELRLSLRRSSLHGQLMPTIQGFGQHEPLNGLGLHSG